MAFTPVVIPSDVWITGGFIRNDGQIFWPDVAPDAVTILVADVPSTALVFEPMAAAEAYVETAEAIRSTRLFTPSAIANAIGATIPSTVVVFPPVAFVYTLTGAFYRNTSALFAVSLVREPAQPVSGGTRLSTALLFGPALAHRVVTPARIAATVVFAPALAPAISTAFRPSSTKTFALALAAGIALPLLGS